MKQKDKKSLIKERRQLYSKLSFGLFDNERDAQRAQKRLNELNVEIDNAPVVK